MPLFRAVYIREGRPCGMTFWAACPALAAEYAYTVIESYAKSLDPQSEVLTVLPSPSLTHGLIDNMIRGHYTPRTN